MTKNTKVLVRTVSTSDPDSRQEHIARLVRLLVGPQPQGSGDQPIPSTSRGRRTQQVSGPISYSEIPDRIVGRIEDHDEVSLLHEGGDISNTKTKSNPVPGDKIDPMAKKRRAPMVRNRRPGKGGRRLKPLTSTAEEELAKYGEIAWNSASFGARVGVIHVDPEGDTVIMCRVSSDERGDTLEGQLAPTFALCSHHDLKVRLVILAEGMSGTRAVRADRELATPTDIPMRDDIHLLDWLVEREGWPINVVIRAGDRIARERLPMETILNRWERYGLSLWISDLGRRIDYQKDALLLGAENLVASAEVQNTSRRTYKGALDKGPMKGKGWLGNTRFGFLRDEDSNLRPDPAQWPFILRAFELADVGVNGKALSTREVTNVLAEEGCAFDHDRVRTILKDPIYATGEFTVKVEGIDWAQTPVELSDPVPIDRFERVQRKIRARKGSTKRTAAGEFALNYVKLLHQACLPKGNRADEPLIRIRGYSKSSSNKKVYRHFGKVPSDCKGTTWEREDVERPVIEAIRHLAEDPEIVAALSAATAPSIAATSSRLSDEQREAINSEIEALEREKIDIAEEMAETIACGASADPEAYRDLTTSINKAIEARTLRLDRDEMARLREDDEARKGLQMAFLDAVPIETPDDDEAKRLRALVIAECISRVVIDDSNSGELVLTVYGPLVPEGSLADGVDPVTSASHLLDAGSLLPQLKTDLSAKADKSVLTSRSQLETPAERLRAARGRRRQGEPAWRTTLRVPIGLEED